MACPFCGLDPYEYVDVGFGSPGVPVAVNCCEYGWLLYDGGDEYKRRGMPFEKVIEIYKEENDGKEPELIE